MEVSHINNVLKHSINHQEPPPIIDMPHLRTPLYPHQIQLIHAMRHHKAQMLHGFPYENEYITGKVGIVADPPGSGKSLVALAYLGLKENPQPWFGELNTDSNRYFFSHRAPLHQDSSSINVIIVPPTLLNQWQQEIETHTRLKPFIIGNRRLLRNNSTYQQMLASDLLVTTSRVWKEVYTYTQQHRILWNNLFIDEATSIYLHPNEDIPSFQFIWLITSNWISLQFRNQHLTVTDASQNHIYYCSTESSSFYRHLIPWNHTFRHLLVLRNHSQTEYPYPSLNKTEIVCRQQYTLLNIPPSILGTNYDGLTHEQMPMVMAALNMGSYTTERVKELYGRSDLIDSKRDDDCSICLDAPQNTVILPCCMNLFCGACILRQLIMSGQCPTCRSPLALANLHPLNDTDLSQNSVVHMTKQDACLNYIRQHLNSSNSFLVYTLYDNIYYQMQPKFEEAGISCDFIEANRFTKTVSNFNNGNTKVLFISNIDFLRGLTLKATHLLLFYAVPSYEREQILIHSLKRVGSEGPKQLVQLVTALE